MARPTKAGVDYFPVDTNFDDKIELLIADKGAISISVLITTWQLIYQNEGYYINANDDLTLLIKRKILLEIDLINEVLEAAIKRGIFDKKKHDKYKILTSRAIQKRYFIAAKKKKEVKVVENYLLEGVSGGENSTYSGINVDGNATKEDVEEDVEEDVKKDVKEIIIPEWLPTTEWNLFLKMRKSIKKIPTEHAKELLINDLENLKSKGHAPVDVLNQSIKFNWQGLFEIKRKDTSNGTEKTIKNSKFTGLNEKDYSEGAF